MKRQTGAPRRASLIRAATPSRVTVKGQYPASTELAPNPRRYVLRGLHGHRYAAYRLTLVEDAVKGQYYGIQGTTWRNPPLLAAAHQTRKIGNRTFRLYMNGGRLRMVAWDTPKGVYWVSNTLTSDLSNGEMLGIASSLTRVRVKH